MVLKELIFRGSGKFVVTRYSVTGTQPFEVDVDAKDGLIIVTSTLNGAARHLWHHTVHHLPVKVSTISCNGSVHVTMDPGDVPEGVKTPLAFDKHHLHIATRDTSRFEWALDTSVFFKTIHVQKLDDSVVSEPLPGRHVEYAVRS